MDNDGLEFLDFLPKDVNEKVRRGQEEDEANQGITCGYKTFSIVIRDAAGVATGVLSAYTAFAEIYVDDIWVDPDHRRAGLGRRLLEALENRYRDKGYDNINLVTSQFQAVEWVTSRGLV
jgi:ribosomal protein S18 acetylase RimI-like enzyme